jgi:endoglucanase
MPRYGFNVQWMFSSDRQPVPEPVDERLLDVIAGWGFDFVRIPCDYRFLLVDADDYDTPNEAALVTIDSYLAACRTRGLHLSLNLHRAPGYVITGWETERYNLWSDEIPQVGFATVWRRFAERYAGVPGDALSFDLVNEPPAIGQRGFTRDAHEAVIRRTVSAVRDVDANRPIVIDGLDGGNLAMPELADLGVTHSTRGYQPMLVSHYRAAWWPGSQGLPEPTYPCDYDGRFWDRESLRAYFAPWVEVAAQGVEVHVGEMGCYEYTPQDVALRWFSDLLSVFADNGWGYALWNFEGPFGIVGHHRPGASFEQLDGYLVDRQWLDVLLAHRVDAKKGSA